MWLKTTAFMAGALILPCECPVTALGAACWRSPPTDACSPAPLPLPADTAFVVYKEATHAHGHDDHVTYPHMKVRRKAFPWAASDCDFFDLRE